MRTFGNILWHFPFFGFVTAFISAILGLIFIVTVVFAPIGFGLLQLARFYLTPFSSVLVDGALLRQTEGSGVETARRAWDGIAAILWVVIFGIWLALLTAIQVAFLFVSILGIPAGIAVAKSFGTIFNPVGKVCVPRAVAEELENRAAKAQVDRALNSNDSVVAPPPEQPAV